LSKERICFGKAIGSIGFRSTRQTPVASNAPSSVQAVFAGMNATGIVAVAALSRNAASVAGPG
jgi:hypothetical protein